MTTQEIQSLGPAVKTYMKKRSYKDAATTEGYTRMTQEVNKTFEDVITIADLDLPTGREDTDEGTILVAKVSAPLTAEQLEAMVSTEDASVADVAVDGEKKVEGR